MRDLSREQLFQLRRNLGFWIVWVCVLGTAFFSVMYNAAMVGDVGAGRLDSAAFGTLPSLGIFCAFTVSAILASDYTEGSVRVRVMAGYSRAHVYLASFFGACIQCALLAAAALLADIAAMPILGPFEMAAGEYFLMVLLTVFSTCVYAALFTMITMLMCNRTRGTSASVVVCGLLAFAMIICCAMISSALSEPEYTDGWDVAADGSVIPVAVMPNPAYISEPSRGVLQAMLYALPSGQLSVIAAQTHEQWAPVILWSVAVTAVCTAIGILVFRRKDLQ